MSLRIPLVVGNWKMLGDFASNLALLDGLVERSKGSAWAAIEVVVCPSFAHLAQANERLRGSGISWGAQDVSDQAAGAFTGEVSATMLRELGCTHAIVGHSERRAFHGETDTVVANKAQRLLDAGICPILCVGESLAQRQSHLTEAVLAHQVDALVGVLKNAAAPAVLAYEPVWAIGTGQSATPEMAQSAHHFIRERLRAGGVDAQAVRLLYGGSVNASNCAALFAQPDIDGGLVGGASRNPEDFGSICLAAVRTLR
jgi:triosephosphate isomerase